MKKLACTTKWLLAIWLSWGNVVAQVDDEVLADTEVQGHGPRLQGEVRVIRGGLDYDESKARWRARRNCLEQKYGYEYHHLPTPLDCSKTLEDKQAPAETDVEKAQSMTGLGFGDTQWSKPIGVTRRDILGEPNRRTSDGGANAWK